MVLHLCQNSSSKLAMCDLGCIVGKSVNIMNARSNEFARRMIGNVKKIYYFI